MKEVEILDLISEYVYNQDLDGLKTALDKWKGLDIAKYNRSGYTLLHVAAKVENSAEIIEFLVNKEIDINCLDSNGNTPLHEAVLYQCSNNLEVFINAGGDVNLPNEGKTTPLITACSSMDDNIECVKMLLENGAKINDVTNHLASETALIAAISLDEEHEMALVKYLIEKGADVNLGGTIMTAISYENIEMLHFLIEKGAKINRYININGENDLAFAKRVGNKEIIDYLEQQI